jgi:hypothetical protein
MLDFTKQVAPLDSWPAAHRVAALRRILPRAKVHKTLRLAGRDRAPCPRLPGWFMVWFVVALGLFCRDSYRQVFRWLSPFRRDQGTPGRSTLCMARHRLGVAPLRRLAEAAVGLLATPATPGAFYKGLRLLAVDGFVADLPDTPANARVFGRPNGGRAPGAFPQARVVGLCEVGTHVLWRWLVKPCRRGEPGPACWLARRHLRKGMLLLADRLLAGFPLVRAARRQKAQLLARLKGNQQLPVLRVLADGSYLSKVYPSYRDRRADRHGIWVRVIEYTFHDPRRPGSGQRHRLLTTLLSARHHPARELVLLYHERWEEELTIDEVKTHQREQRLALRSETPAGVVQELEGLLLAHYVVRVVLAEAAQRTGAPPRQMSFVEALKILRCRLPECPRGGRGLRRWYDELVEEVSREVLPQRRERLNPRVIKRKMSKWPKKRQEHRNPPKTKKFCDVLAVPL